jgi:hypothetical protein
MKYVKQAWEGTKTFFQWGWLKAFIYWLVKSAGTMSEFGFLLSSLWLGLNANAVVHQLILAMHVTEKETVNITGISIAAFTALPILILGLGITTTYEHIKAYILTKAKGSLVWGVFYGVPTFIFLGIDVWTIASAVTNHTYTLPNFIVVARSLGGYSYGIIAMLHMFIGAPSYGDKLADLNRQIAELESLNKDLISRFEREKESLLTELKSSKERTNRLAERALQAGLEGLSHWSIETIEWVKTMGLTVTIDEIEEKTGLSKRKINSANIRSTPRNKEKFYRESVIDFLKKNRPPSRALVTEIEPQNVLLIEEMSNN